MSGNSLIRFLSTDGRILWGLVSATSPLLSLKSAKQPKPTAHLDVDVVSLNDYIPNSVPLEQSLPKNAKVDRLLAPVPTPTGLPPIIYAIGLNYRRHAAEIKAPIPETPVVFVKSPTSITGTLTPINIPKCASKRPEVDYEVELAVVIGKECKNVKEDEALNYVLGYTVMNDVTARRWQGNEKSGGQWCFCKSFDTFSPLGPAIRLAAGFQDPNQTVGLRMVTTVNGDEKQNSTTDDMVFSVKQLISFLSQDTTLLPGTLISTGTPSGVGFKRNPPFYLSPGDEVVVGIEGIGQLANTVAEWGDATKQGDD